MGSIACASKRNQTEYFEVPAPVKLSSVYERGKIVNIREEVVEKSTINDHGDFYVFRTKRKKVAIGYTNLDLVIGFVRHYGEKKYALLVPDDIIILICSLYRSKSGKHLNMKISHLLHQDKIRKLFDLYIKSEVEFYQQCVEFGFTDDFIDNLTDEFRQTRVVNVNGVSCYSWMSFFKI